MECLDAKILAHATRAIHVYRHLLREATYLPDRIARRELQHQIVHRFRKNLERRKKMLHGSQSQFELLDRNLKTAEKGLKKLRKANNGSIPALLSCLKEVYCQSGRRRYKLLEALLVPDHMPEDLSKGDQSPDPKVIDMQDKISQKSKEFMEHPIFDPPKALPGYKLRYSLATRYGKLNALVSCPRHEMALGLNRPIPRKLEIDDMRISKKRIKNKLKKWYAKFLSKIPVPLPEGEWMALRDLALGKTVWEGQPKRRARPGLRPFHLSKTELERFIYLEEQDPSFLDTTAALNQRPHGSHILPKYRSHTTAVRLFNPEGSWMESKRLRRETTQDILEEELQISDRFVVRGTRKSKPHAITGRFMRRLWARVFRGIPLLRQSLDGKWSVTWGHDALENPATSQDLSELFESLESR